MQNVIKDALISSSEEVVLGKGKNIIPPKEEDSLWLQYLEKFKDPIIYVLAGALALSLLTSIYEVIWLQKSLATFIEPVGVMLAILLSTGIAFVFEVRANRAFRVLNKAKDARLVKVFRRKAKGRKPQLTQVERADVVVGDIVKLDPGDEIPADAIVLEARDLSVDESIFTGEMMAHKGVDPKLIENATYPCNMLLRGATVIDGSAFCKITAVGLDTEEGKGVALEREGAQVETPLSSQLDRLGKWISVASFVVAGLIIVGRMLGYFAGNNGAEHSWIEIFEYVLNSVMIAVTLIVVAVPEGLPMSITMSLALSMRKMLKANNLVRKLHACETMGATTVICTDKTGTLTQNKMQVVAADFPDKELMPLVVDDIAINSTAELEEMSDGAIRVIGNPTEGALLKWLSEQGINYADLREEAVILHQVPFSTENKSMETTIERDSRPLRLVKGAPELLLDQCAIIAGGKDRQYILDVLTDYQAHAMRTLGFAYQEKDGEMVFLGVIGIADPVREDVPAAIDMCMKHAGVRVIIVTGDNMGTATEIGRQIGLLEAGEERACLEGPTFASMTDDELQEWLPTLKVLSRAKPEDKSRLVELLQKQGEVVAVTGDGTNDALALSKAQVGLSMGDGTSRAKEASDITIIDNSFASINLAIMWGRSLYLNIRRFIIFQMTINLCACLVVLIGAFMGVESPLTVTQMLWVNLIMDTFAAMALSSLPADPRVLNDKPRDPESHIVDRKMLGQIVAVGLLFFVVLLGLWQLLWHIPEVTSVKSLLTAENFKLYFDQFINLSHAHEHMSSHELGIFFSSFVMLQFWNLFNVKYFRTDRSLLLDIVDLIRQPKVVTATYSWGFLFTALIILIGQVLIVSCFYPVFEVAPLSVADWGWILLLTSMVLIIPETLRNLRLLIRRLATA